jgi:hypothetical protein
MVRPREFQPAQQKECVGVFPPNVLPSNEHLKLVHDERRFERPYIPESAWWPLHRWPATDYNQWCGEWSAPNVDDQKRHKAVQEMRSRNSATQLSEL